MNSPFFYLIVLFLLFAFIIKWIKSKEAEWMGWAGEQRVRNEIDKIAKAFPQKYRAFYDLYVQKRDGSTSQIDHLILSRQGLFVIETKNYSGWIFGDEQSKYWTQVIYRRKEKFLNPIWQNKGHIKAIKEWIGEELAHIPIYSVVIFMPRAKWKSNLSLTESHVIYPRQLKQTLEQYQGHGLDDHTMQRLDAMFQSLTIQEKQQKKKIKKQHIQSIQSKQQRAKESISEDRCPRCGGQLVLKKGKYGMFKGCNYYPKCRFTEKIS
ncbi:NERD domain-containing protein [Anoxybacteroides rupiense]|uniref:NERD domain-containing protein n=1 Tax=Anoxybacteroides rupiense TaxID=311460 RepID=UPI001F09732A|nr:NERD domain-containing protein [Anoxybacillus rupiensis]